MSGNVHPNPGLSFLYSVGAGNMTIRGKLVPYSIRLRGNFAPFSKFNPLSSSHSWSCPSCCIVSPGVCFSSNTMSTFLWPTSMYFTIVSSNSVYSFSNREDFFATREKPYPHPLNLYLPTAVSLTSALESS